MLRALVSSAGRVASRYNARSLLSVSAPIPHLVEAQYVTTSCRAARVSPWDTLRRANYATEAEAEDEDEILASRKYADQPFVRRPRALNANYKGLDDAKLTMFSKAVLYVGGYYNESSQITRAATLLYKAVLHQAETARLYDAIKLEDNFQSRHAIICLHIWMLMRRLAREGPMGKKLSHELYDEFQEDIEMKVYKEGVRVRTSKWLREFEEYFYGSCTAFDTALKEKTPKQINELLRSAIWKNIYLHKGPEKEGPEVLRRYVAREMACLYMTDAQALLRGHILFNRDY